MSILWCGGEDIDFNGTITVSTTSNYRREGYARCSLQGAGVVAHSNTFGPVTSCWFSTRLFSNSIVSPLSFLTGIIQNSTYSKGFWLSCDSSYRLTVIKYDGSTSTVLCTEPSRTTINASVFSKIDIQITYGASGSVKLYVDGVLAASYTGDTTIPGVTQLDAVAVYAAASAYYSELIVSDEDTRLLSLATIAPNAAGDSNAWTGAYTDINEYAVNDATLAYTNTPTADAQFGLSNPPTGTFTIKGVKLVARVAKSAGATAGSVCLGVKSGGTIDAGTAQACDTAWATKERVMQQNPVTANNWQTSEINALQLNIRSAA